MTVYLFYDTSKTDKAGLFALCYLHSTHTLSVLCRVDKNFLLILDIKSKYCCNVHAAMTKPGTCAIATKAMALGNSAVWIFTFFFLQLLGPIYQYLGHFIRTLLTTAVYVG